MCICVQKFHEDILIAFKVECINFYRVCAYAINLMFAIYSCNSYLQLLQMVLRWRCLGDRMVTVLDPAVDLGIQVSRAQEATAILTLGVMVALLILDVLEDLVAITLADLVGLVNSGLVGSVHLVALLESVVVLRVQVQVVPITLVGLDLAGLVADLVMGVKLIDQVALATLGLVVKVDLAIPVLARTMAVLEILIQNGLAALGMIEIKEVNT